MGGCVSNPAPGFASGIACSHPWGGSTPPPKKKPPGGAGGFDASTLTRKDQASLPMSLCSSTTVLARRLRALMRCAWPSTTSPLASFFFCCLRYSA